MKTTAFILPLDWGLSQDSTSELTVAALQSSQLQVLGIVPSLRTLTVYVNVSGQATGGEISHFLPSHSYPVEAE